ncbi:MAG: NADH-quinone oxidoreductase subunit I [Elusimicrobiota bacterium]
MTGYFGEIFRDCVSLLKGMRVTLRTMLKPAFTVQYPTEKLVPYAEYRGVLLFDPETCISCSQCAKACPSSCIVLENAKNEAGKKIAKVDWYSIDLGKCNFCRLCEEACPTTPKSVWHSLDYELAFDGREDMVRCWRQGFGYVGKVRDRDSGEFKDPSGQVLMQKVQGRR